MSFTKPVLLSVLVSSVAFSVSAASVHEADEMIFDDYFGPNVLPSSSSKFAAGFFSYVGVSPVMDFFSERACGIPLTDCSDSTTQRVPSACTAENLSKDIPDDTFYVNQTFFVPSIATCENPVVRPDNGHLYVNAWYDLTNGPVRISSPALRFSDGSPAVFAIQFLDPLSNNIFHISPWGNLKAPYGVDGSIGENETATDGLYAADDYYLYWSQWDEKDDFLANSGIPARNLIESDNKLGWMLGRIIDKFDSPDPTRELCAEYCAVAMGWDAKTKTLTPLDVESVTYEPNPLPEGFSVTCGEIEDPIEYLDYAASALGQITWPSGVVNDFYKNMMTSIGVDPDIGGPSSDTSLTKSDLAEIAAGFEYAESLLCGADSAEEIIDGYGFSEKPWVNPLRITGSYGQRLFYRAMVAQQGFGAETTTYEYYPTAKTVSDPSNSDLISYNSDGEVQEYLIVMDASLDDVCSMWSLTMYYSDASQKTAAVLCENQNNSCSTDYGVCVTDIGTFHTSWNQTNGPIKFGDKYLILLSPNEPTGDLKGKVNWLPSPNQIDPTTDESITDAAIYFNITLRVYNARIYGAKYLENGWTTPCILNFDRSNALPLDCQDGASGCLGDINDDGIVNHHDLGQLLRNWGCSGACLGDLNGDQSVNGADVAVLISTWGDC